MFPATHLYILEKITGKADNYAVLGAVFPDVLVSEKIKWHNSHCFIADFYENLIADEKKKYINFFKGCFSHAVDTRGVDYYGDKEYKNFGEGYSFKWGRIIEKDVARVCGFEGRSALWPAHNFIEMAIELFAVSYDKTLPQRIFSAVKSPPRGIIEKTADYFKIKPGDVKIIFENFSDLIPQEAPSLETLAEKYSLVLKRRHNVEGIDIDAVADLIEKARAAIEDDYNNFINYCVVNIDFSSL